MILKSMVFLGVTNLLLSMGTDSKYLWLGFVVLSTVFFMRDIVEDREYRREVSPIIKVNEILRSIRGSECLSKEEFFKKILNSCVVASVLNLVSIYIVSLGIEWGSLIRTYSVAYLFINILSLGINRNRDMGKKNYLVFLLFIPLVNLTYLAFLLVSPSRDSEVN